METVELDWLKSEARSFEKRREDAMLRGDASALAEMLADDLIYLHSTGIMDTKLSYLDKIRSCANIYEELSLDVLDVVPLHRGALVIGDMAGRVRLPVQLINVNSRFMTVWQNCANSWMLVGHQAVAKVTD